MPRKSAEERSGDLYRAGAAPPPPPDDLDDLGKGLWRQIASSKPADQWNPGALDLLKTFCQISVQRDRLVELLFIYKPGTQEYRGVFEQTNASAKTLKSLADGLRLTIQNLVDRKSGRITEKGVGTQEPEKRMLLGGKAVWREQEPGKRKTVN